MSAILGKGQDQLFNFHAPKVGSHACPRWQSMGGGIFYLPLPSHGIPGKGWRQLFCHHAYRPGSPAGQSTGSALGCCPGEEAHLLSCVLQLVRGRARPPSRHRWQGVRGGRAFSLTHATTQQMKGSQSSGSHARTPNACSPAPPPTGSVLLCCPGEMQGLLFLVLLWVGGNATSTLMTSGSALLSITGSKG